MRTLLSVAVLAVAMLTPTVSAQPNPFLGAWNMTGTGGDTAFVYWLKVEQGPDGLTGRFLNRTGSPLNLGIVKIDAGELIFQTGRPDAPTGPEYRARIEGDRLVGRHTLRSGGRGNTPVT